MSRWKRFRKWYKYRNSGKKSVYYVDTKDLTKFKQSCLRDFFDKDELSDIYKKVNKLTKEVLK